MNEYTRREEIFWTLVAVCILVPSVAIGIIRLMRAEGPMVTDPAAATRELAADGAATAFSKCPKNAASFREEISVFQSRAALAEREAREAAAKSRVKPLEAPTSNIPWTAAERVIKLAKSLEQGRCRKWTEEAVGPDDTASAAWKAVASAANASATNLPEGTDDTARQKMAQELNKNFNDAKIDLKALVAHATKAQLKLIERLTTARNARVTQLIRGKLPEGLVQRGPAIGIGVGVSLAALLVSYASVRSASMRRARTLGGLRRFANTQDAGLQAAGIVRIAAHHNGGEPGLVIGASVGGLLAALLAPHESPSVYIADLFVAGSMGGLLIGLAGQWLHRTLSEGKHWRERAKELSDIEKPTVPMALVLGGVTPGLEKQFMRYFATLPIADAAVVVEKLAQQAEEQILAAAELAAQQSQAPGVEPRGF
ncbi:MAG: hypothetical protein EXR75_11970 [Myxococcales bacterium]|nr:hypothetical protein [Myxococcales bacterium]